MNKHRVDERTWWLIFFFTLILLVLVLCGISFGATGPQDYIERRFARNSPLSEASRYLGSGDQVRCFNVSLTDTTAAGFDATYAGGYFQLFRMSQPDSGSICDCYKINGSPDSLIFHGFVPGRGYKVASAQWSTNAQGRIDFNRTLQADSVNVVERLTTADLATGAGTIGTAELADSLITAAKIPASTITAVKIAANAVGASEIATSAVGTAEIADGVIADADIATGAAIALTKLSTASASTNDIIAYSGSAWAKTSTVATPINTTTITASGAVTLNGAVTLGDAPGDAITSTGNFTTTGTTTCGNDTTDVTVTRGVPRWPDAMVKATYDSGSTSDTFTFPNAKAGWSFIAQFGSSGGKAITSIYYSSANTVTVNTSTTVAGTAPITIWGWKP